jgi:DNA topoisomerase-1
LKYVSDRAAGIRRRRSGSGFTYLRANGRPVRDGKELGRIRALAVPPAWTDVWICADPDGHLQATGRDARGRKQYRYHPRWRARREADKYGRMIDFGKALPRIRRRYRRDLKRPRLDREKVLATVVRLLEGTLMRVGNEEYARENRSYGLTTLRDRHAEVRGASVRFTFKGKSGRWHSVDMTDARVARVIRRLQDLPGQELFQYRDGDELRTVTSDDVNDYIREAAGDEFTAKDFRTWAGTVLCARALQEMEAVDSEANSKRNLVQAIESVAAQLGNTVAVCRRSYIHPALVDAYLDGSMARTLKARAEVQIQGSLRNLRGDEAAVLVLLQRRLAREARRAA